MALTVWVIESGEYDQRGVDGVAATPESALEWLKAENIAAAAEHPSNKLALSWTMEDTSFGKGKEYKQITITGITDGAPHIYELSPYELNEGNVENHTLARLGSFVDATAGKRITYKQLIAEVA